MNPLERLDPEELVALSDVDFQETIKLKAKALAATAMDTIEDVMSSSDDGQARLAAATKTLDLAGARDASRSLPMGVSDEVFRIALAGFAQLASIAHDSNAAPLLRDVSPARSDPRVPIRIDSAEVRPIAKASPRRDTADFISENDLPEGLQMEDMDEQT